MFFYETKASIHLSQIGECVYGAQSPKKKRLLSESMFIPIDRWNLIIKNGGKWSFFIKPKRQCHLSQPGEWLYGAQSWKEKRLFYEFMFVPINKWTLILKMVERESFLWNQSINVIYPNEKNEFMAPNHEKKGDYYMNPCF